MYQRRKIIATGLALCLALMQFSLVVDSSSAQILHNNAIPVPRLSYTSTEYDFGTVREGEVIRAEFLLKNTGEAKLVFEKIISACGCMVVSGVNEALAPQAETKLLVNFDTTGFSGNERRTISIQTNDRTKPLVLFSLRAQVKPRLIISPQVINFAEIVKGSEAEWTEQVTVQTFDTGIVLGEVILTNPRIHVRELQRKKDFLRLELRLSHDLPFGEFRDRIIVLTPGSKEPSFSIPLYAFVKSNIRIEPQQISFGLVTPGSLLRRRIKLDYYGKDSFIIKAATLNHPALQVSYKALTKKQYMLEIILDPSKVKSDIRANLLVDTNLEGSQISIPVYAITDEAP